MDDKGYLIVHPSLIDPKGKGPAEEQHITHKESLLANDILNHKVMFMISNSLSYSIRIMEQAVITCRKQNLYRK